MALAGAALADGAAGGCDRERGERVFTKCAICHARDAAATSPVGPHLNGVVGRQSATLPGFKYSKTLRELRQAWTPQLLDRFLADPMGFAPGTVMAFTGLKDAADRAAVICLLAVLAGPPMAHAADAHTADTHAASAGAAQELAHALQQRLVRLPRRAASSWSRRWPDS